MDMKIAVTTSDGDEKRVAYVMKMLQGQLTSLCNVKEVLEQDGACTEEKIATHIKWGEIINEFNYGVGELTKDEQIKSIVKKNAKPELKSAVETLIWVIQRGEEAGFHDENLNSTLKPHTITPQKCGSVELGKRPYNNSTLMHILIQILEVTTPPTKTHLFKNLKLVEIMGELGATDDRYGNDLLSNSKERQKTVDDWLDAPIEKNGLRKSDLSEVRYGEGYKCVLVKNCGSKGLMHLIKLLLE